MVQSTPPAPAAGESYTCGWCGTISHGSIQTCPACGAPVNIKAVTTRSGWVELPGLRDMTRIQFGHSTCQVEGTYVPAAEINLVGKEWVYFTHHILLWKDSEVSIDAMAVPGTWQRTWAGQPLMLLLAQGPGRIAFSRDAPGEVLALPLQPGQAVDVREHAFLVANSHVSYGWSNFYPLRTFMDTFSAGRHPGLLLLHGAGNIFIRHLAPHQTILVKPSAFLFKDSTVDLRVTSEYSGGVWAYGQAWGESYNWLRLHGPGRVAVQSAYKDVEEFEEI
jgi:uncharacterized protein (AIM24 family)